MGFHLNNPSATLTGTSKRTGDTVKIQLWRGLFDWYVTLVSDKESYSGSFYSLMGALRMLRKLERYHQVTENKKLQQTQKVFMKTQKKYTAENIAFGLIFAALVVGVLGLMMVGIVASTTGVDETNRILRDK